MALINITGLDKEDVLAALFNGAEENPAGGLEFLWPFHAQDYILEREGNLYFDYVYGRSIHADISGDTFYSDGYNEDNGENRAETIIANLRETGTHFNRAELDEADAAFQEFMKNWTPKPEPTPEIMDLPSWDD